MERNNQRVNLVGSTKSPQPGSSSERSEDREPASTASRVACQRGGKQLNPLIPAAAKPLRAGIKTESAQRASKSNLELKHTPNNNIG